LSFVREIKSKLEIYLLISEFVKVVLLKRKAFHDRFKSEKIFLRFFKNSQGILL